MTVMNYGRITELKGTSHCLDKTGYGVNLKPRVGEVWHSKSAYVTCIADSPQWHRLHDIHT